MARTWWLGCWIGLAAAGAPACSGSGGDDAPTIGDDDDDTGPETRIDRWVESLDGDWELAASDAEAEPVDYPHTVPVPGFVDLAQPPLTPNQHRYYFYRRSFQTPDSGAAGAFRRAFLKLHASQYGVQAALNGQVLGSHTGPFTSHAYEMTDALVEGENSLVIRVGRHEDMDLANTAVGDDIEKESFLPGLWDRVEAVYLGGDAWVRAAQALPDIDSAKVDFRLRIDNRGTAPLNAGILVRVRGSDDRGEVRSTALTAVLEPGDNRLEATVDLPGFRLWSPDDPFLYRVEVEVSVDGQAVDRFVDAFGMRKFEIRGSDFYFNHRRFLIRGSNIALHRWFSDPARGRLPWDASFVKRALIDVAKAHHLNYFRFHVGIGPSLWYETADREGMLLQDEWMFWGFTFSIPGNREAILADFAQWIEDHANHPSIVMWDMLNEGSARNDAFFNEEIGPAMREMDPTRVIEPMDFKEWHTYHYGQEAVLNIHPMGWLPNFIVSPPLADLIDADRPTVTNEFPWLWFNDRGEVSSFTAETSFRRLLGPDADRIPADARWAFQAWLTGEMIELYRRMGLDGIQPFVYLGDNEGTTYHYFRNPLEDLRPKPVLEAIRNGFEPFGVGVELWDRHFFPGETRAMDFYFFNDDPSEAHRGELGITLVDSTSGDVVYTHQFPVQVGPIRSERQPLAVSMPSAPGVYELRAALTDAATRQTMVSRKPLRVYPPEGHREAIDFPFALIDPRGRAMEFLEGLGHAPIDLLAGGAIEAGIRLIVAAEGALEDLVWVARREEIAAWVGAGGRLVLIEPSYGRGKGRLEIWPEFDLRMEGPDSFNALSGGGYDSILWSLNRQERPRLFMGIEDADLWFFNGAYGNEITADWTVLSDPAPSLVLAVTGPGLTRNAVFEVEWGAGRVIVFEPQLRGRLVVESDPQPIFNRRVDPVAQRWLLNLIEEYGRPE